MITQTLTSIVVDMEAANRLLSFKTSYEAWHMWCSSALARNMKSIYTYMNIMYIDVSLFRLKNPRLTATNVKLESKLRKLERNSGTILSKSWVHQVLSPIFYSLESEVWKSFLLCYIGCVKLMTPYFLA